MSVYSTRKIKAALLAKGFHEHPTHHEMYWLMVEGKKTPVHTWLSHGINEYGNALLGLVAKEMRLGRRELDAFIQCPLGHEQYAALLGDRGVL